MVALANGARRSKTVNGKKIILQTALGGNACCLYINLRGRAYWTNPGRRKFLVYASQEGLAWDLDWDLKESPKRLTNALNQLIEAKLITRYVPTDESDEALEIRKAIGWRWKWTNIYELILFKDLFYQGHFNTKTTIKKGRQRRSAPPLIGNYQRSQPSVKGSISP